MKANINCGFNSFLKVFINGKENKDCCEASEEDGYALVAYQNVEGKFVDELLAEKGSLVANGIQVLRVKGDIKIETAPVTDMTDDELRQLITREFVPLAVTIKE